MVQQRNKKIIVIGAGLGGISAAISLASEGYAVEIYEKNGQIGGKLNTRTISGYTFDLGPSILILPQFFQTLFERAGKEINQYIDLVELSPQWRNFFEDGTIIDLDGDIKKLEAELVKFDEQSVRGFFEYIDYSRRLYHYANQNYFQKGYETWSEMMQGYGLLELRHVTDFPRSMAQGIDRFIKEPHWRDMLQYFIKYVGSSAYQAPAVLNLLLYSQLGFGLFYVSGGMYNLARAFQKFLIELGVQIHLNQEVIQINKKANQVSGIVLKDGTQVQADVIISNMEVIPAYERLLQEDPDFIKKYSKFEPACSGLVIHLGLNRTYDQLQHHNFFYSRNQKKHFHLVFQKKQLPPDPTIYLVAPTKTDTSVAPEGHEIIKILPHIPPIQDPPFSASDYDGLKERLYEKLERMGLENMRKHIVVEDVLVPDDIERMYYSNKGSIYGVVSSRGKNLGFKAPKNSEKYTNLYFVGGSVNPGPGMPMVLLSGQQVRDRIVRDHPGL